MEQSERTFVYLSDEKTVSSQNVRLKFSKDWNLNSKLFWKLLSTTLRITLHNKIYQIQYNI